MSACPVCATGTGWSVLVTTQVGVRLPGDSRAAEDEQTNRELRVCEDCGVCYDPVVASGPPEGATGSPSTTTGGVGAVQAQVDALEETLTVLAGIQAGMAESIPGVDSADVLETLADSGVGTERREE